MKTFIFYFLQDKTKSFFTKHKHVLRNRYITIGSVGSQEDS